ncbi:MAG: HAMP domain-containing histidine kinase [Coriobacteriia bacterium]|nr:HAMP domain-containing histidine kinase [Coriobacteriia bacterium]MCL2870248.1 HAMP domain-containing histidine kinase [Coriobacteriia bacterium]
MKFLKWHLVPHDELRQLQDMSGENAHTPPRGQARFEDPALLSIAKNFTRTKAELQTEVQHLEVTQSTLESKLSASKGLTSKAEQARKETRLEHMQTDFIAAASHELKTPLAGIEALGDALQMALQDDNPKAAQEFIQHIKVETSRMRALTEDLLDLSRFDENPDSDSVSDLRAAINSSVIMPKRTAKTKDLELEVHFDESLGTALLAKISPTDLSIILDNLLDNALHYTKEGHITLKVGLCTDKEMWILELHDTGEGIAAHDQAHVFERFYRADRSRSRDNGGTGLGLALVKKASERWKGDISLQSELGVGSIFTVKVPVA